MLTRRMFARSAGAVTAAAIPATRALASDDVHGQVGTQTRVTEVASDADVTITRLQAAARLLKRFQEKFGLTEIPDNQHVSPAYVTLTKKYSALASIRKSMGVARFFVPRTEDHENLSNASERSTFKILAITPEKIYVDLAKHAVRQEDFDAYLYPLTKGYWGIKGKVTHPHPDPTIDVTLGELVYEPYSPLYGNDLRKFNNNRQLFMESIASITFGSNTDLMQRSLRTADKLLDILLKNPNDIISILQNGDNDFVRKEFVGRFQQQFADKLDEARKISVVTAGFADLAPIYMIHAIQARLIRFFKENELTSYGKSCMMVTDGLAYDGMSNGGVFALDGKCVGSHSGSTNVPGLSQTSWYVPIEVTQEFFMDRYPDVARRAGISKPDMPPQLRSYIHPQTPSAQTPAAKIVKAEGPG